MGHNLTEGGTTEPMAVQTPASGRLSNNKRLLDCAYNPVSLLNNTSIVKLGYMIIGQTHSPLIRGVGGLQVLILVFLPPPYPPLSRGECVFLIKVVPPIRCKSKGYPPDFPN